jgi:hypothetical protein
LRRQVSVGHGFIDLGSDHFEVPHQFHDHPSYESKHAYRDDYGDNGNVADETKMPINVFVNRVVSYVVQRWFPLCSAAEPRDVIRQAAA